ncbi:MAG: carboxypeptidase regulatory-like domain-containing protein, partial [Bryobacteraceae bacterium]
MANARIEIRNASTGAKRSALSDASGFYAFPQLAPGIYHLTAGAPGFSSVELKDIRVSVNSPVTADVKLEVGNMQQSLQVTADTTQVNTTDATIGHAFGTTPILQLPLEGRNVVGLLALQPGVAFIGENQTDSRNGAVNGGKSDQANVTLDGVDVNDQQERSAFTSVLRVTLDSVQEFRVITTNANADQGRSSGAQIALVTKSGTNQVHGSLYEFHRNTITTANSFINNSTTPGVARPKLIRNTFGAAVGGPVQKNRLFYFLNYEGRRDAKEETVERIVPTESFRLGSLKYERANAGGIATLSPADVRSLDPLRIGPNAGVLRVLQSYPLPNTFNSGDGLNTAGFRFVSPLPLRWNTYIARFDYQPSESGKHALFLRGNLQNDHVVSVSQYPGDAPRSVNLANSKGLGAGYNLVATPHLVGSFRYGLTRQGSESSGLQTASAISFLGIDDRNALTRPFIQIVPVHNTSQDFTWTQGAHNVQFGAVQRWIRNSRVSYANSYHFAQTRASRLSGSGSNLDPADLNPQARDSFRNSAVNLLGILSTASANYNFDLNGNVLPVGDPVARAFKGSEYEMYVQDSWRAARGLTLTVGLRWSLMPPIEEENGLQIASSPSLGDWFDQRGGLAQQGRPASAVTPIRYVPARQPGGSPLYDFHKRNLAPRLALAYSPQAQSGWGKWLFGGPGRSSIRAGWGMYYDLFGQSLMRSSDANSFGLQTSITTAGSLYNESTAPRFTSLTDFPSELVPAASPLPFPITAPFTFVTGAGIDSNIKPPYSMNMTFSLGRDFGGGFHLDVAYVGRLSRRSLIQSDIATPT